jgi:sulfopyruvate decarboxylase alpha subunit
MGRTDYDSGRCNAIGPDPKYVTPYMLQDFYFDQVSFNQGPTKLFTQLLLCFRKVCYCVLGILGHIAMTELNWQESVFDTIKASGIELVAYVPDAGHSTLIEKSQNDPEIVDVVLTTEEEGVALCTGAWLGGKKSALLMQSSGVGNCINMFSLRRVTRTPLVVLVTMRGEYAEFNPWQIPMGSTTEQVLKLCNFQVYKIDKAEEATETVQAAIDMAYNSNIAIAVLMSQKLLGRKEW